MEVGLHPQALLKFAYGDVAVRAVVEAAVVAAVAQQLTVLVPELLGAQADRLRCSVRQRLQSFLELHIRLRSVQRELVEREVLAA
jgi:hypothetical protein